VDSVEEALQEMFLQIIHQPYRELINAGMLRFLIDSRLDEAGGEVDRIPLSQVEHKSLALLRAVAGFLGESIEAEPISALMRDRVRAILELPAMAKRYPYPRSRKYPKAVQIIQDKLDEDYFDWLSLLTAALTSPLGMTVAADMIDAALLSQEWLDDWLWRKVVRDAFEQMPFSPAAARYAQQLTQHLTGQFGWNRTKTSKARKPYVLMSGWLEEPAIQAFLGVNTFNEIEWFNGEALQTWLEWMLILGTVDVLCDPEIPTDQKSRQIVQVYDWVHRIEKAAAQSEYQVENLLQGLK
jgi:hypothetical protein